ncbi:hypothetical protein K457DRAFT_142816 [Linnemannia elongata AG-77]|uniref:Galactose oxidase n=1 Tax=Linnemannia elongata AG-77 TaxID=1314771 RepID=A0A197JFK2_9FUNG|nr:hypothetical protein K457DRAFT_142816 [Linnemannia elongata AG-77]
MMANGSTRRLLTAAAALAVICCSFTPRTVVVVFAQVVPIPVQDMAWVRSGSNLYVQGGYVSLDGNATFYSTQFFALDLSTSWPVTSAPWRALPDGTGSRAAYGISLPTNQTFLTFKFVGPTAYTITAYDFRTSTSSAPQNVTTVPDLYSYGLRVVMDPTSGLVYIAGMANMNIYNTATQTWGTSTPITGGILTARYFGSAVYNPARKTIMYVCGFNYGVNPTHFDSEVVVTEYTPATAKWSILPTSGSPPSPTAYECSAISEDSKTLVVFGGQTSIVTPAFTGAIHLLDINTGVWTAGPPLSTPRIYAACVLIGDQFVVWGGSADSNNTLSSNEPIVFDVALKQWVKSYTAPAYYLNAPKPTNPPNPMGSGSNGGTGSRTPDGENGAPSSSSSSSSAGIIGGVVGGLAVIAAIIGFLLYRRRLNKKLEEVKEQVSLQRMVIEAERSNKAAVSSSSGGENISTTASYPTPPAYLLGNKTTTQNMHTKKQSAAAASSPTMSSPAVRVLSPSNNGNNLHGPQLTKTSSPHAVQMNPPGGGFVSWPQEYNSPTFRSPQTLNSGAEMGSSYHEQESVRIPQNHPQERAPHSG